jgi:hypothetical protein
MGRQKESRVLWTHAADFDSKLNDLTVIGGERAGSDPFG